jgi:AcrR family transcriptional regulator
MSGSSSAKPGAAPAQPPTRTADRLLDAAAELFRRKGYAQATTRELAEALGIRKATLYHHIKNKQDLLEALCLESLRRLTEEIAALPPDAPDHLRAIMVRHLTSALRDRNLHAATLGELHALAPERRARVAAGRRAYQQLIREAIAADQARGYLRDDIDAEYLTLALLNLLNWSIYWYDAEGAASPEQLADMLADVFLQGAER